MRMNEHVRASIVHQVEQALPVRSNDAIQADAQRKLLAGMSPAARQCHKKSPKALRMFSSWDLGQASGNISMIAGDADPVVCLADLFADNTARKAALQKLSAALKTCSTVEQARKRFPELAEYMPSEKEPTKNLPALTDVVAGLRALGWKG